MLAAQIGFDFTSIASDLNPTLRYFGSPNPDNAPFDIIRFGEGTLTSIQELPALSSLVTNPGDFTFEFGSTNVANPVEVATLQTFDNGLTDGLANQVYVPDINDDPTVTFRYEGVPVIVGRILEISLETTPTQIVTSPESAPSRLQITGPAGLDSRFYDGLLDATNGTGIVPFTLNAFALTGPWAGVGDAEIFESTGQLRELTTPADSTNDQIGIVRGNLFYTDTNGDGIWNGIAGGDAREVFGMPGDEPLVGDWDGNGFDNIGVNRGNQFYLDTNGNGVWDGNAGGDDFFFFGIPTDSPVIGDWNGDGKDSIGIKRGNQYYLDKNGNGEWNGVAGGDTAFFFGLTSDEMIAGDWDGDGADSIGIKRGNQFYLDTNGNERWDGVAGGDEAFFFGITSDVALSGDWDGDGVDSVGIQRQNFFYLDSNGNGVWDGLRGGDGLRIFGVSGDVPITGRWASNSLNTTSVKVTESVPELDLNDARPVLTTAISLLDSSHMSDWQKAQLLQVQIAKANLSGTMIGVVNGSTIYLDTNAAGHGWFVDPTPDRSDEFVWDGVGLLARSQSHAFGKLDLLSVLLHELEHVLGEDHESLLDATLAPSVRRI